MGIHNFGFIQDGIDSALEKIRVYLTYLLLWTPLFFKWIGEALQSMKIQNSKSKN